ncbi:puromycin-sensitive aminopeptidase-like [Tropilaelaps mercedesae]|uniref:Aminopeptidase n=1 Tax=Tropilaelaps mercedesae TaxID=418985 RepID=A0A1V9X2Y2_9ACAR|nr:puromycin-sensitive aminopeptidase-like [Tropilaelaps mercedesae]
MLLGVEMSHIRKKHFARLGNNILPEHYKLLIKIDTEKCTFNGSVEVNLKVNDPCASIVLYSLDLVVSGVELQSGENKILAKEIKELKEDERVEFVMEKPIPKGKIRLPTSCRRAFPCWDEPAIKATFEVTTVIKKGLVTLSNTLPVEEMDDEEEGWTRTRFERTPKMSTYLVCFVVGQYDYIEALSARSVRVRIYTPVGKKEQGRFALDMAVKSLNFFEDFFKVPYPLNKIDLIGIPDFPIGAMENWGILTFREVRILSDTAESTTWGNMRNAMIIAHEISHQWFGNLVTMEWWTCLWLKEGFAKFMETVALSAFAPEFDIKTQFPCNVLNVALELDALDSSHPIEVDVNHPSEVEEIFDKISYQKGASVIAMLHHYVGAENFRNGLHLYITRHAYSNTTTEDLWAAISETSGLPVGDVMDSWIKQMGFPIISVKSHESGSSRILEIKQEKFYSSADKNFSTTSKSQWNVPLVIGASGLETKTIILNSAKQEIEIENAAKAGWIHVNYGAVGVFRVHYEKSMLDALLPAIREKTLPPADRFMLHSDLFALVKAGYASTKDLLTLTRAYSNENELSVWESIFAFMECLDQLLDDQRPLHEKLCRFARQLFSGVFEKLGWDAKLNEKPSDAILRTRLLGMMVQFKDAKILEEARRRFHDYITGTDTLGADVRKAVYRAVAMNAHNQSNLWDELLKLHRTADMQEEIVRIASSLGYAQSKDLLLKVLELSDSDLVRSQDVPFVIGPVASSSVGRELAWTHFTANFDKYKTRYNSGLLFHHLISVVGSGFHSMESAREFKNFFQKYPVEGGERTVRQTLECIENNANWLQRDGDQLTTFLSEIQ